MRTLLKAEIVEVANGVLLTIEKPSAGPTASDPMGQRDSGFAFGPQYYETLELAIADIHPTLAVREARKALQV
jgi:hypothetical protein